MWVYPRVCGGTCPYSPTAHGPTGLSPRVRGNLVHVAHPDHLLRSIPACAGEPGMADFLSTDQGVYPRVCGGTQHRNPRRQHQRGLSPRVRGNHLAWYSPTPSARSIPACAGEPRVQIGDSNGRKVYPRVCGGTTQELRQRFGITGLSPRVRGNRG